MLTRLIHTVHRFIPFTFALFCACVLIPSHALADIVQSDSSQSLDGVSNSGGIWEESEGLGTGLSGTFDGIQVPFRFQGFGAFRVLNFQLFDCPDATYTGCTQIENTNSSLATTSSKTMYYATFGGESATSSDYYFIVWDANAGSGNQTTGYGSTADTYPNGTVFPYGTGGTDPDPASVGMVDLAFTVYGLNGGSSTPQITRIDTVSPSDGEVIATSSLPWNYTTTGYVAGGDFSTGARLRIKIDRNTDAQTVGALLAYNAAFGNNTYIPITGSGSFNLSTTSINNTFGVDRPGEYTMTQQIQVPGFSVNWWIFNFDLTYNTLVSTTTTFTVSTSTAVDIIVNAQASSTAALLQAAGDQLHGCQFNWFNSAVDFSIGSSLMGCITALATYMFVPSSDQLSADVDAVKNGFAVRVPWGYATRFVEILTASSTPAALPTWTAVVATSRTSSTTFTFDPGDMLVGGANTLNSITDPNSGLTLRQVSEPILLLFIGISLLIIIFHDLMAMGNSKKPPPSAK